MEGSLASVFMEGSLPALPMSWATQEESIEELQHRLVCTSMELQTTGEAAKAQRKLDEAKLGHLQDLLEATKKERDEAFQERKKLQECLLHLSNPQQVVIAPESPCTTSSCGQPNHQHPLSYHDLDSSCFLHNFKPKPIQTFSQTHDLQSILCLSEGPVSSLQEPQQFCMDFLSEDKAFEEDQNFGDLQEQFSMDLLIEDMAFDEDESLDLADLLVEQPLHSNWEADLSMKSSWESHLSSQSSSISSADSQLQSGTDGKKALAMSAHTPAMSSAQLQAVSSSQCSAMAKKASSSPAMSMSASQFTETVKKDMPSSAMSCLQRPAMSASQSAAMAKKATPSSTMPSPCIPAISASHSSAMAMPSGAMPSLHIPTKAPSQYSSMAKEAILSSAMLSPHMPAMSVSPSSTMAKKAMLSLASTSPHLPAMPLAMPSSQASRTAAKKAHQLPTSMLPQKRVHLPEPPEANIDVMLSSLPEKGKLLEAVMKAGPLLQQLLLAGPLPHWQHPPPNLHTMDIPKVPMSPNSVLMPVPHVQHVPSCMAPNNMPTSSSFLYTMKGISPCLLPTSATAKSSMHLNHNPSNSCSSRRKLPKLASRGGQMMHESVN